MGVIEKIAYTANFSAGGFPQEPHGPWLMVSSRSLSWGVLVMATGSGLGRSLQLMRDHRDPFSAGQAFQHLEHPHGSMRRHENGVH